MFPCKEKNSQASGFSRNTQQRFCVYVFVCTSYIPSWFPLCSWFPFRLHLFFLQGTDNAAAYLCFYPALGRVSATDSHQDTNRTEDFNCLSSHLHSYRLSSESDVRIFKLLCCHTHRYRYLHCDGVKPANHI